MQFSIIKLDLANRNLDLDFYSTDIAFLIFCLCWTGKRYVHGMGSETRNSLYHLHNGREAAVLTTCKHGKNWRDMQDDRLPLFLTREVVSSPPYVGG
jgi:hypothetical protein